MLADGAVIKHGCAIFVAAGRIAPTIGKSIDAGIEPALLAPARTVPSVFFSDRARRLSSERLRENWEVSLSTISPAASTPQVPASRPPTCRHQPPRQTVLLPGFTTMPARTLYRIRQCHDLRPDFNCNSLALSSQSHRHRQKMLDRMGRCRRRRRHRISGGSGHPNLRRAHGRAQRRRQQPRPVGDRDHNSRLPVRTAHPAGHI